MMTGIVTELPCWKQSLFLNIFESAGFKTSPQFALELAKRLRVFAITPPPRYLLSSLPAVKAAQLLTLDIASSINRCAFSSHDCWSTGRQSCSNLPDLFHYRLSPIDKVRNDGACGKVTITATTIVRCLKTCVRPLQGRKLIIRPVWIFIVQCAKRYSICLARYRHSVAVSLITVTVA